MNTLKCGPRDQTKGVHEAEGLAADLGVSGLSAPEVVVVRGKWGRGKHMSPAWLCAGSAATFRLVSISSCFEARLDWSFPSTCSCFESRIGCEFPGGSVVKNLPTMQKTWVPFLCQEESLKKEMATYSSILAWEIPWTEEPGRLGLQARGLQESHRTSQLNHNHYRVH